MTIALILVSLVIALAYIGFIYRAPDLSRFDLPEPETVIADHEVSLQHDDVVSKLRAYHQQPKTTDIKIARQRLEDLFYVDVDAVITPVDVEGIPAEWVIAEGADPDKRLLYIHGGAFTVGSPRSHRYITAELSKRAGVAVLATDYRMQPEFKTIACHEDARIAYRWILDNGPGGKSEASQIFVAGDSAGGNLTLSVIAWARDNGLAPADGAIALAPLTDATFSSPTFKTNLNTDPFLAPSIGMLLKLPKMLVSLASRFSGGLPPNDPALSPLFGHLGNLPPTLVQVSKHEMLYADARRYANKARAEGGDVTLQVWPKMVHVFQGFGADLPEAQDALDKIAEFIRGRNTSRA